MAAELSPTSLATLLAGPWALTLQHLGDLQAHFRTLAKAPKLTLPAVDRAWYTMHGSVAVVDFSGLVFSKNTFPCRASGGVASDGTRSQIEAANADPCVKSILVHIDSVGGSLFGTPELAAAICATAKIKPVVAFSDATMLAAAYWVGSAANAVYISGPTVQVGGIGVVASHNFDPTQARGTTTEITAGKYKRIATPNAPLSTEGLAYLQGQVDHLYSVFVDAVAVNRGASTSAVLEHMADGRVFIGQQAIKAGLVDSMLPRGALLREMAATPEKFSNRRRVAAHRVNSNAAASTPKIISAVPAPAVVRALTKAEIAAAAIRLSQATGCNIVAALHQLGVA